MIRPIFEVEEEFLPCTMQQFETLTNEMLTAVNIVTNPHALNGDYMAQVVMGVLHGMDKTKGTVKKVELFEGCIRMVSNHVTFHAVKAIEERLKAELAEKDPQPLSVVPDELVEQ